MNKTSTENLKVVTRFAPSPTGYKHLGNYRTALFSYIFAKQHNGSFILRIEDTDKARNKKEFEENIYETLEWLRLPYEKKYIQSEHIEAHKKYLHQMINSGHAYISKEEAKDGSGKINELVRFKNPNIKVSFIDIIRGTVEIDTTDLGDFVIAKNLDEPLFHLAVVVDDFEAGVTHVLRGEDHVSNTPRHVLIQRAIGAPVPQYAHLPLLFTTERSKMSSRKGALPPTHYRELGYLPEAMINYLSLLGWHPSDDKEIFTFEEIIERFDLSKVQKASAVFDEVKLKWVNKEHMLRLPISEYEEGVKRFISPELKKIAAFIEVFPRMIGTLRERLQYFGEIKEMETAGELQYFFMIPSYDPALLLCAPKMRKGKEEVTLTDLKPIFEKTLDLLAEINESNWNTESIKKSVWAYAEEQGRGLVLWALRVALSGKERSPDPFTLAYIVGKSSTLERLSAALKSIQ
ncbi:MAG: glutamate--tRNA ligase family protein [Patescibacteria group bacterium]